MRHFSSRDIGQSLDRAKEAGHRVIAVIPIGSVEQHGPSLPVTTDSLIAETLSAGLCERLAGDYELLNYPPLHYTPCSSSNEYNGNISVENQIFRDYLKSVLSNFLREGLDAVLIANGHGTIEGHITEVVHCLMETQYRNDATEKVCLFLPVSVYAPREALAQQLGYPPGRHADWYEFLHVLKVLGREYFDEGRLSHIRALHAQGEFDRWKYGFVGVPTCYRAKKGVLGQPLPDTEDFERLADRMWAFVLDRLEQDIRAKLEAFFLRWSNKKGLKSDSIE